MPTLYVSKTVTNGYAIGNDSNDGSTKALAKLTVLSAISTSSNNDTITINDGTYDESFTITGKTGLTIEPENDYLTTFTNPGTTRVVLVDDTATGLTLGRLILDGESNTTNIVEGDGGADVVQVTIDGTQMKDPTSTFIDDGDGTNTIRNLTMLGGWSMAGTITSNAILLQATTNDSTYNISDGTITISVTASGKSAIFCFPTGVITGTSLTVDDVTMNITESGTLSTISGVRTGGVDSLDVTNCNIAFTDVSTSSRAVHVENNALATSHCFVLNNIISGDTAGVTTLGYGVLIGKDGTDANDDQVSGIWVEDNTISNFDHGLLLGAITNGVAYANSIDLTDTGIVSKYATTCDMAGNLITRSTDYIQTKASVGDIIANNTIIMSAGFVQRALWATNDAGTYSNGTKFTNNNVYSDATVGKFADVENFLTNEIEFYNNNFYSTVAPPANAWNYNGVDKSTLVAFDTAVDLAVGGTSASTEIDPEFTGASNYSLQSTSGLVGAGIKWWTRPPNGIQDPFPSYDIDVGAYQSNYGPFHPVNL